ncbi:hypothetical protein ACW9KT_19360 [Hymenobacter sp. HD11105]
MPVLLYSGLGGWFIRRYLRRHRLDWMETVILGFIGLFGLALFLVVVLFFFLAYHPLDPPPRSL